MPRILPNLSLPFQGMTVQAINGASREDLLRLSNTALRIWDKISGKGAHDGRVVSESFQFASSGKEQQAENDPEA